MFPSHIKVSPFALNLGRWVCTQGPAPVVVAPGGQLSLDHFFFEDLGRC